MSHGGGGSKIGLKSVTYYLNGPVNLKFFSSSRKVEVVEFCFEIDQKAKLEAHFPAVY
jgi:hypothetical protein